MKEKTLLEKIISNPFVQTIVIYVSGGWILLEIVEYFIEHFGLNEGARNILLIILLCIFPLILVFAWYLHKKQKDSEKQVPRETITKSSGIPQGGFRKIIFSLTRTHILFPGVLIIVAIVITVIFRMHHQAKINWARDEILPKIEKHLENSSISSRYWIAFDLATEAARYIPDDPLLNRLWSSCSRFVDINSEPQGASVYAKPCADATSDWRYLGITPVDSLRFPSGYFRIKFEKEGFSAAYDIGHNYFISSTLFRLQKEGSLPDEMEMVYYDSTWYHIPGVPPGLHLPGLEHIVNQQFNDLLMDRYEVTNKEYKQFIDDGGYQDPEYWKYPFVKDGNTLGREEAMKFFIDKTGSPGPATWEVGDYPEGQDDYPVSGVSWYEAAAYAKYAGKELPTIYHWDLVALTWASSEIVPVSNINGDNPLPAGSSGSMNRFGIFDMSGNVREWCFNMSGRTGERFILGGGWNDPDYAFNDAYTQSPFDRSEINGFRCIKYLGNEENRINLVKSIQLPFRDFLNEPKVSDETFALFLNQYAYDKTELNAIVESVTEEDNYTREKISFDAAYGNERMMAYLFLPKTGTTPYQTVVYFPGSNAIHNRSSESLSPWEPLLKSGRAVIYPVYKSTYERGDDLNSDYPSETIFWKEHVIMWAKDLGRSIDYLETREDIDTDKLAFYGVSWGGAMGAIMPAVENRIKTSVLYVAGLLFQRSLPEVDQIHFLPRIKTPVLMLNGKYDHFFPYETSQLPFYELLGTPEEHKKIFVYEGGHSVPRTERIKESLAWLDNYLGTVDK